MCSQLWFLFAHVIGVSGRSCPVRPDIHSLRSEWSELPDGRRLCRSWESFLRRSAVGAGSVPVLPLSSGQCWTRPTRAEPTGSPTRKPVTDGRFVSGPYHFCQHSVAIWFVITGKVSLSYNPPEETRSEACYLNTQTVQERNGNKHK